MLLIVTDMHSLAIFLLDELMSISFTKEHFLFNNVKSGTI